MSIRRVLHGPNRAQSVLSSSNFSQCLSKAARLSKSEEEWHKFGRLRPPNLDDSLPNLPSSAQAWPRLRRRRPKCGLRKRPKLDEARPKDPNGARMRPDFGRARPNLCRNRGAKIGQQLADSGRKVARNRHNVGRIRPTSLLQLGGSESPVPSQRGHSKTRSGPKTSPLRTRALESRDRPTLRPAGRGIQHKRNPNMTRPTLMHTHAES